jgi:thiamine biosynthesis lipoprotein
MATRFELLLGGDDPVRLRAAGEEALRVIVRLEAQLSRFRPASELSRINARAGAGPVPVESSLFALLQRARHLFDLSGGAFDITIAPLMACWGFGADVAKPSAPEALERARAAVGMDGVELDERRRTIRFARPGMQLDLGGIGKGCAIDRAVETLRELGVKSALLHGGTSSVYGLGAPADAAAWQIAVEPPSGHAAEPLAIVPLADRALGVSAVWGRTGGTGAESWGHVMSPRAGRPVRRALLAAAACASATDADALATALLAADERTRASLRAASPGLDALVLARDGAVWRAGLAAPHGRHEPEGAAGAPA